MTEKELRAAEMRYQRAVKKYEEVREARNDRYDAARAAGANTTSLHNIAATIRIQTGLTIRELRKELKRV